MTNYPPGGVIARIQTPMLLAWVGLILTVSMAWCDENSSGEPSSLPDESGEIRVLRSVDEGGGTGFELHPVTIFGQVTDTAGHPIPRARIFIGSTPRTWPGGFDLLRGTTTTDDRGCYRAEGVPLLVVRSRPTPVPQPVAGDFMVFVVAERYGVTWHPQCSYRPEEETAGVHERSDSANVFHRSPMQVDLTCEPPAVVQGRITNDLGEPIPDAKVQFGRFESLRLPHSSGGHSCRYLGPQGEQLVEFSAIALLPANLRETRTDQDGRYRLNQLRRDSAYFVQINPGAGYDALRVTATTAEGKSDNSRQRFLRYEGILDHEFTAPREVVVRVTAEDTEQPLPEVTIHAHGSRIRRDGVTARTDADGTALLRLTPDSYTLSIEPTPRSEYIASQELFEVTEQPTRQEVNIQLRRAAVVEFQTVAVATGTPVPGVRFEYETDTTAERQAVHSQTVYCDYPVTDSQGKLRVVLAPGRKRFVVATCPPLAKPEVESTDLLDLTAGTTTTVQIEFDCQPSAPVALPSTEGTPYDAEMVAKWARQRELLASLRGHLNIRRHFRADKLPRERVDSAMEGLASDVVPDLSVVFRDVLNEPFGWSRSRLTIDGNRLRSDTRDIRLNESNAPLYTTLRNGFEGVTYSEGIAQADVFRIDDFRRRIVSMHSLCTWPHLPSKGAEAAPRQWTAKRQDGRLIVTATEGDAFSEWIVSQETGFLYRLLCRTASGFGISRWQFAPKTYENGMILPGLSIEVRFRGNETNLIEAYEVESVDPLERLPADAFSVALPAGVNVLDWRGVPENGPRRPKSGVIRGPISDVVAYLNHRSGQRPAIESRVKYGHPAAPIKPAKWLTAQGEMERPDLAGKVLLVEFWDVTCGPCVARLPEVQATAEHFAKTDLVVIGLHSPRISVEDLAAFAAKHGLTYPLAIDRPASESGWFGATTEAYGVHGIPTAAVIDRDGNLVYLGTFQQALERAAGQLDQPE